MAVLRPGSTEDVALILRRAQETGTSVVPVAGNTGLNGGTKADGALMVSLERMNRIREIRPEARIAIVDAGVIGVPVGGQDQRVKAFVVLEDGVAATEDEIISFCRERLARYKLPRDIEFRDELPKTFVGKVLRRELMAEEKAKQDG